MNLREIVYIDRRKYLVELKYTKNPGRTLEGKGLFFLVILFDFFVLTVKLKSEGLVKSGGESFRLRQRLRWGGKGEIQDAEKKDF